MHRGCFVWTPTPPLGGRRTPLPGPARVCVRVLCLAGLGGPASWAHSGAPHLFLWPLRPCSLFSLLRAWVALFAVCFFFLLPFVCLRCLRRSVFSGPGCLGPWRPVRPAPPPLFLLLLVVLLPAFLFVVFFSALFVVLFYLCYFFCWLCSALSVCAFVAVGCAGVWCCCRCGLWCVVCFAWCCVACLCLAGFSCLAVRSRAALGPVGLFLLCSAVACCCVLCCFFFVLLRAFPWWSFLFWSVWCSAVVCLAFWRGPVALRSCAGFCCAVPFGALPCHGASLGSVLSCCFAAVLGSSLASSAAVACCCALSVLGRGAVSSCRAACDLCAVVHCAVFGCLPFRGASCVVLCWCACVVALYAVLSRPSGAGWCCVLLPVVFGCVLLGLAVLCCLLVAPGVVFWWCCPCLAVWLAALWFGVVCLAAQLRCVVFCVILLSRGGVLSCPDVCLRPCLCLLFVSWRCAFYCVCPCVLPCGWSACCGALLPCVVSCGALLSCGAALWCSGVFLRCCVCLPSLLMSCSGGAVPVWPCGSPPCGLVSCVWVLHSAVLCSVVLCCCVVVCCRALLSVCVVCLCLLFVSWRCAFCCVCPGLLPCGWSACCEARVPCVVSCGAVLSCGAALSCSGVGLRCCVWLPSLFSFKTSAKPVQNFFSFEKKNSTLPNTPASNRTIVLCADLRVTRRWRRWRRCSGVRWLVVE